MPVVTIRGLGGSGSGEIGKQVADKLHVDYVSREIIAKVAERIRSPMQGIEEKEWPPGSIMGRIAEALGRVHHFEGVGLPAWEIPLDDATYLAGLESVIRELAGSRAIVIVGRGSQFILRDYPEALHVLVVAPLEVRVKRVMETQKSDEETAKQMIVRYDNSRREFIKKYFHAELEDPVCYDLVINTEHLSLEAAASIVVDALPFKDQTIGHTVNGGEQMQGYCMKCRTKKEMKNAKAITMKNGKPATQGVCPTCGTKVFRIGKA